MEREQRVRALLVDQEVAVRELLAMLLDRLGQHTVVAEAGTGVSALKLFRRYRPDLIVVSLNLPEINGSDLIGVIRKERSDAKILVFTGNSNDSVIQAALRAMPHGFVHRSEPLSILRQALLAVSEGNTFFSPFATRHIEKMQEPKNGELPPKLRTVLQLIAEGMSTKQAATLLALSPKTVEHYRTQLMQKLGLRDVASLTRYAVRCGLVAAE